MLLALTVMLLQFARSLGHGLDYAGSLKTFARASHTLMGRRNIYSRLPSIADPIDVGMQGIPCTLVRKDTICDEQAREEPVSWLKQLDDLWRS